MNEPDYIVLRHGPDIPEEYWAKDLEGVWLDRSGVRLGVLHDPALGHAVAEPTNRIEYRYDNVVAEVWEIRMTTPNERRSA